MTDRACQCGNPLHNQQTICGGCSHALQRNLREQPWFEEQITVEMARLAKKVAQNDGGRASSASSWAQAGDTFLDQLTSGMLREWDRRHRLAGDLLTHQRRTLTVWARNAIDKFGVPVPRETVRGMAGLLAGCIKAITVHDCGPAMVDEFYELRLQTIRVIDLMRDRLRIVAGPCCEVYDDEHCPGAVWAIIPREDDTLGQRPMLRCDTCKVEWAAEQWVRAGARINARKAELERQKVLAEAMTRKAS